MAPLALSTECVLVMYNSGANSVEALPAPSHRQPVVRFQMDTDKCSKSEEREPLLAPDACLKPMSWARRYPEKNKAKSLRWYYANKEQALAKAVTWNAKNPEKARAYSRKWSKANVDRLRVSKKAYRDSHRERVRIAGRKACGLPEPTRPTPEHCECCAKKFSKKLRHGARLDHCHLTGVFRGWICGPCNSGIGMLGDSIDGLKKAIAYLEMCRTGFEPVASPLSGRVCHSANGTQTV